MDMEMDLNDHGADSDDPNGDGEGVWSPDIEQCFREALLLFPPCGRRKHILQEEGGGKMYGRNELIARHIMMRTGKSRTRKQVSSHIQVLARRKAKAEAGSTSSAGVSPSSVRSQQAGAANGRHLSQATPDQESLNSTQQQQAYYDNWLDRPIVTQKIRLVEFSAFVEYRNFQQTAAPILNGGGNGVGPANLSADLELVNSTTGYQQANQVISHHQQQQQQPLASNHHLPAQFNQATGFQATPTVCGNNNGAYQHQKQQLMIAPNSNNNNHLMMNHHHNHHHHQQQHYQLQIQQPIATTSSAGFTRHSYIQIDYTQNINRQTNKLERIDISQIQDKFPEIGGSDGLFQRGPSDAFFLIKFWADLNNDYEYNIDDQNSYFGFSSHFETVDPYKDITCSTKACSYGLQVVEKVEKIYGAFNSSNGRYSYDINRSPMCEFMIQFIRKLRQLPRASQMNSVLENFTVLQVITSESTSEILLCLAYVFEVASTPQSSTNQTTATSTPPTSTSTTTTPTTTTPATTTTSSSTSDLINHHSTGPQYHVYKLAKD